MQKIIIDTNVLVSSLIQKNYPYLIVNHLFIDKKIELCVSKELMEEYYEVLSRKKFSRFPDFFSKAQSILTDIELSAQYYTPEVELKLIKDDKDNMILELADICEADYIITGNSSDFDFENYKRTLIVNPKQYWENHQP
jgi:putative PIN family toxin of toxin-antitoxin system